MISNPSWSYCEVYYQCKRTLVLQNPIHQRNLNFCVKIYIGRQQALDTLTKMFNLMWYYCCCYLCFSVTYGCSDNVIQTASHEHGTLFQYERHCYEIVPVRHSFLGAEKDCVSRGAHLVHITSDKEQAAIYQVVKQYHGDHVWIGLQDRVHEERFTWTSGNTRVCFYT